MIQANVAAAETLEARKSPLVYRIHDSPSLAKLEGLRDFLKSIELSLPKGGNLEAGAVQPAARTGRGDRERPALERGGAAHPGAGRIQPGEHRPFRPQPAPLRPLHLAHPPLCRPHRPSRAGALAEARSRRPARRHRGAVAGDRGEDLRRRAPRHGGRARHHRPAGRPLARRPRRRHLQRAHLRRHPRRPVRQAQRHRRRRLRAHALAGLRLFPLRRGAPRRDRHAARARCTGSATRSRSKLVEAVPLAGALRFELLSEGRVLPRKDRPAPAGARPAATRRRRRRTGARSRRATVRPAVPLVSAEPRQHLPATRCRPRLIAAGPCRLLDSYFRKRRQRRRCPLRSRHRTGKSARSRWQSVRRGFACRCPHCGEGKLFRAWLKPVETCPVCGEDLSHQRADDFPPYITMVLDRPHPRAADADRADADRFLGHDLSRHLPAASPPSRSSG